MVTRYRAAGSWGGVKLQRCSNRVKSQQGLALRLSIELVTARCVDIGVGDSRENAS